MSLDLSDNILFRFVRVSEFDVNNDSIFYSVRNLIGIILLKNIRLEVYLKREKKKNLN